MWIRKKRAKIEGVKTEIGNDIILSLKAEGWKITSEYSSLMFDKGIDHDFYILKKNGQKLKFEWDNWFEWTITGKKDIITDLANKYGLTE